MRIALTGGIACGKSLLSRYLNEAGVETLDADDVVHQLESPGGEAAEAVLSRFGTLDRAALAALCFGRTAAHAANRRDLESILFPRVKARMLSWCDAARVSDNGGAIRVAVVPLLFETGWNADFDLVACVASSPALQMRRLMENRGMTRASAQARLAAQMPASEKEKRSGYVIRNDGAAEELKAEARRFADFLKERTRV